MQHIYTYTVQIRSPADVEVLVKLETMLNFHPVEDPELFNGLCMP